MADTFDEKYNGYKKTLDELNKQTAQAQRDAIVADTTLKNLQQRREEIIKECESFAGVKIDMIPAMLQQKKDELDNIMNRLSGIDLSGNVTDETINQLTAVMQEFGLAEATAKE